MRTSYLFIDEQLNEAETEAQRWRELYEEMASMHERLEEEYAELQERLRELEAKS